MKNESLVIRGGRLFDPGSKLDRVADLLIEGGRITRIGKLGGKGLDAKGLLVVPGLIDMHVHLREPGQEDKETIASGARAAVKGGFTSVVSMANTGVPIDDDPGVVFIQDRARRAGLANVFPVGAVSRGLQGKALAELGRMADAGAVAFSDDGKCVMDSELMRRALEYCKMLNRPILSHCEDVTLTQGSIMNEGEVSTLLGLRGWPNAAEASMAARDIYLAGLTGGRLHIQHVSARETVDLVRWARKQGLPVTAEAAPHHLALTDESLRGYESRYRMNPPLRTAGDVQSVLAAVADGTIAAIASDHAPHTIEEKEQELAATPNGVVGLETTVGIVFGELVAKKKLSLKRAVEAMTSAPAQILGLPKGSLRIGADADVTLLDLKASWTVDPEKVASRGRSTPFEGMKLRGRAAHTIVAGRVVD